MADLPNLANPHYAARINRAIDHIIRQLAEPLSLSDVARVAGFSPYHFHRIFRAQMGETLAVFVKRLRLERAVYLMSHRPGTPLTQIAYAAGFRSSSDFSRSFRAQFGVPPRRFDVARFRARRRNAMRAALTLTERHPASADNPDGFQVRLRDLPARRVVYLRVHEPYADPQRVPAAAERLIAWARARGLAGGAWLGYQWDDPEIVPLARCRYDLGVVVPDDVAVDLEEQGMGEIRLPTMRVAQVAVAGPIELELRALEWLYGTWLPKSGYAPAHQPCFEAYDGLPFAHGQTHFSLRLQLPLVDAAAPLFRHA